MKEKYRILKLSWLGCLPTEMVEMVVSCLNAMRSRRLG